MVKSYKIYCGTRDPPEGKKRGTEEQCVKTYQIRYYGFKKISSKTKNKMLMKRDERLMGKKATYRAKMRLIIIKANRLKKSYEAEEDKKKKEELLNKRKVLYEKWKKYKRKMEKL